jgi:ABC-type glycerol-3-phosphate transport system permease component
MSAPAVSPPVAGVPAQPRIETRRERKQRERLEEADANIPVEFFGLKRGTTSLLTACCVLFAIFTLIPIVWIIINSTKTQANLFNPRSWSATARTTMPGRPTSRT